MKSLHIVVWHMVVPGSLLEQVEVMLLECASTQSSVIVIPQGCGEWTHLVHSDDVILKIMSESLSMRYCWM